MSISNVRMFVAPPETPVESIELDSQGVPVSLTDDGARRWDEVCGVTKMEVE